MQEFDNHDIDTSVQLDHVEAERISKTPGLGASETSQIGPSTEQAHQENYTEEDTDDDDDVSHVYILCMLRSSIKTLTYSIILFCYPALTELHPRPDEEPSIFDIFDDSEEDQQE